MLDRESIPPKRHHSIGASISKTSQIAWRTGGGLSATLTRLALGNFRANNTQNRVVSHPDGHTIGHTARVVPASRSSPQDHPSLTDATSANYARGIGILRGERLEHFRLAMLPSDSMGLWALPAIPPLPDEVGHRQNTSNGAQGQDHRKEARTEAKNHQVVLPLLSSH